jgi:hypothetical protein
MINDLEVVISENAKRHKTRELLDNWCKRENLKVQITITRDYLNTW